MSSITTSILGNKLSQLYAERIPFAVFSEPGDITAHCFYQEDDHLHLFDSNRQGFIVAPFLDDDNYPSFIIPNTHSFTCSVNDPYPLLNVDAMVQSDSKLIYIDRVARAIDTIKKGHLQKVVLARKETINVDISAVATFLNGLALFPNTFVYLWHHPKVGTWLGATPEQLITLDQKKLKTISLAATQPSMPSITWDDKELLEQSLVTQWIKEVLLKHRISPVIQGPETSLIGPIAHLKTSFEGIIDKNFDLQAFLQDLHPTPAICGIERVKALEFINRYESMDRAYYTGIVGVSKRNDHHSYYVNIRCMNISDRHLSLYAGCGIVADSIPKKEWLETVHKINAIKRMMVKA